MAYPTDNPMDGRGAAPPVDELDGGIYADGCEVRVRSKRTPRGITLGGPIAEAQNEATAAEIARRCAAFEPMLKFAKVGLRQLEREWLRILENRPGLSTDGLRRLKEEPVVVQLLADIEEAKGAIAQAEGR